MHYKFVPVEDLTQETSIQYSPKVAPHYAEKPCATSSIPVPGMVTHKESVQSVFCRCALHFRELKRVALKRSEGDE